MMELLGLFIVIAVAVGLGVILSYVNFSKVGQLQQKVSSLEDKLQGHEDKVRFLMAFKHDAETKLKALSNDASKQPPVDSPNLSGTTNKAHFIDLPPVVAATDASDLNPNSSEVPQVRDTDSASLPVDSETKSRQSTTDNLASKSANVSSKTSSPVGKDDKPQKVPKGFDLDDFLSGNGLLWLGAIVLALGGIFLAKYSIEAGLLPPELRVIFGGVFGVGLVFAAEYLNKNAEKYKIHNPYICAAIASGGFITCFAMTAVAYDFYHFLPPQVAFVLLAVVAVTCTWMSLRFGPLLAVVGIIGAYLVPALVSTGSNNFFALAIYVSLVSASAIWVIETVKTSWLWWQSLLGHFAWLSLAALLGKSQDFAAVLLFSLTSIYLYSMVGVLGWNLKATQSQAFSTKLLFMPRKEHAGILLSVLLLAVFVMLKTQDDHLVWANLAIACIAVFAAMKHSGFDTWPFLALFCALGSFMLFSSVSDFSDNVFLFQKGYLFVQIATLTGVAFSSFMLWRYPHRYSYLLLLVLAPVCLLGLAYVFVPKEAETFLYPWWTFELLLIAAFGAAMSIKQRDNTHKVGYLVLVNACLTLCLTMLLDAGTLTMAFAVQVLSLSYLSRKYQVSIPDWLFKVGLSVVILRLTIAPWLPRYLGEEIFGIRWSLVIYPAVLAIIWQSKKWNASETLAPWFLAILVHVVALFITTETSFLLVGRYPDFGQLQFIESIILAMNWLLLSVVYFWRSQAASTLSFVYLAGGYLLLAGSFFLHFDLTILHNPFAYSVSVGDAPLNWLIPLWAIPALLLALLVYFQLIDKRLFIAVMAASGVMMFFYINGLVRSLFHEGVLDVGLPVEQMELYAYSIVWLALSLMAVFASQKYGLAKLRKIGFGILALVVLKAFLVDMSNLEGLYRALSFIGLGLSLVGVGWLFQKLRVPEERVSQQ